MASKGWESHLYQKTDGLEDRAPPLFGSASAFAIDSRDVVVWNQASHDSLSQRSGNRIACHMMSERLC